MEFASNPVALTHFLATKVHFFTGRGKQPNLSLCHILMIPNDHARWVIYIAARCWFNQNSSFYFSAKRSCEHCLTMKYSFVCMKREDMTLRSWARANRRCHIQIHTGLQLPTGQILNLQFQSHRTVPNHFYSVLVRTYSSTCLQIKTAISLSEDYTFFLMIDLSAPFDTTFRLLQVHHI